MRKALNIFGTALAIIGVFAAITVMDGSAHEIAIRLGGIIAFVIGVLIAAATGKEDVPCK